MIVLALMSSSCQKVEDDLEVVKQYRSDDKYFKSSLMSLHFLKETAPIENVEKVFHQLIQSYNLPTNAEGCIDGEFSGESPYDAFDYKHVVKIKIKNGRFISVDYNEIKKNGLGKQEDEEYGQEMSVTGTTPAIAYPHLESQLLENQDFLNVDAITGATYSLYRFRYVVMIALMKARLAGT